MRCFLHALFHLHDAQMELVSEGLLRIFRGSFASEDVYCISEYIGFISPEILSSNGAIGCFHEGNFIFIIHRNSRYSVVDDSFDNSKRKRIVVCYSSEMVEVHLIVKVFSVELFQLSDVVMHFVAPGLGRKGKVF